MDHTLIALAGTTVETATVNVTMIKAAALLGSGIAVLGVIGPGVGIGLAGSRALEGMARQPEMSTKLLTNALIIAALMEALGLMAFIMAVMLWQYAKTL